LGHPKFPGDPQAHCGEKCGLDFFGNHFFYYRKIHIFVLTN